MFVVERVTRLELRERDRLTTRLSVGLRAVEETKYEEHGAEAGRGPVDRSARALVAERCETARSRLHGVDGIEVEDKGLSLAIHYRRAKSDTAAELAVASAVKALRGARLILGRTVANVVPLNQHDKGAALTGVRSLVGRTRRCTSATTRPTRKHSATRRSRCGAPPDRDDDARQLLHLQFGSHRSGTREEMKAGAHRRGEHPADPAHERCRDGLMACEKPVRDCAPEGTAVRHGAL